MSTGLGCNVASLAVAGLAVTGAALGAFSWGWVGALVGAAGLPLAALGG